MLVANPLVPIAVIPESAIAPTAQSTRKILHLINGEHFSGAERVQDLLALALPQFGYEVGFACLKRGRFPEQRRSKHCPVHHLEMSGKLDLRSAWSATELVRRLKYQAVHAHTPRTLMIGRIVAARTGLPLVYHVHSPVGRDSTRRVSNFVNQRIETWAARRADAIVCVSHSLAEYMQHLGHDKNKVHVVANGVQSLGDVPARQSPNGRWTIGTTALFRPRKGLEVLLKALARLRARQDEVRLLAVGPFETPAYQQNIEQLTRKLGIEQSITWTGFQTDVNKYFAQMDLFVLPSLFGEGMPMVVLEAMSNGVPVVAARVEGIPEAVRDSVEGLTFQPGDDAELAGLLESFLDHQQDWQAMRRAAVVRQREQFSERSMAGRLALVYDRLLADRR